jgi:hypothetical protein
MRQFDARDFEPSYDTPIEQRDRVEPNDLELILFYVTLAY